MIAGRRHARSGPARLFAYRQPRAVSAADRPARRRFRRLSAAPDRGRRGGGADFRLLVGRAAARRIRALVRATAWRGSPRACKAEAPDTPVIAFPADGGDAACQIRGGRRARCDRARHRGRAARPPRRCRRDFALQGNLDPLALIAGGRALDEAVERVLSGFEGRAHVFNLGHGILPETPIAHVERLVAQSAGRLAPVKAACEPHMARQHGAIDMANAAPSGVFKIGGEIAGPPARVTARCASPDAASGASPQDRAGRACDAATPARARRRLHRHRRFLRPQRLRRADPRGAAPLRKDSRRDQRRADAHRPESMDSRRPAGISDPAGPYEPPPAGRRDDRPVAIAPHRFQGAARRAVRGDQVADLDEGDPPRRPERSLGRGDRGREPLLQGRDGAEPLQPRRPRQRGRAGLLREARHRLHPLVPARGRRSRQAGRRARPHRQGAYGDRRARSRWPGCSSAAR